VASIESQIARLGFAGGGEAVDVVEVDEGVDVLLGSTAPGVLDGGGVGGEDELEDVEDEALDEGGGGGADVEEGGLGVLDAG
jgi:hypothetical protein